MGFIYCQTVYSAASKYVDPQKELPEKGPHTFMKNRSFYNSWSTQRYKYSNIWYIYLKVKKQFWKNNKAEHVKLPYSKRHYTKLRDKEQ